MACAFSLYSLNLNFLKAFRKWKDTSQKKEWFCVEDIDDTRHKENIYRSQIIEDTLENVLHVFSMEGLKGYVGQC